MKSNAKLRVVLLLTIMGTAITMPNLFARGGTEKEGPSTERITLRYWTFIDPTAPGPRTKIQTDLIKEFEEKNPNVKIQVETIPWGKIDPQIYTAVQAGTAPAVSRFLLPWLLAHVDANNLEPLDKIKTWTAKEKQDWVLPWDDTVVNGHKWFLFLEHRVRALYYRDDVLSKAGLPVPNTLYGLLETAKKISTPQMAGFINPQSTKTPGSWAENFYPLLVGAGGKLFERDGKAAFNSPAGVKVMKWVKDSFYEYKLNPITYTSLSMEEIEDAFIAGRTAMYIQGTHRLETVRERSGLGAAVKTAPIPGFDSSKPSPAHTTGWGLVMPRGGTVHKEVAVAFMEHMVSKEAQQRSGIEAGEMPALKSSYDHEWFKSDKAKDMILWQKYGAEYPLISPATKHWTLYAQVLAEATEKMIINDLDPKTVLDEAVKRFNEQAGF